MLGIFFRVIIVMAVFLAGTLVGNIYMPQKRLESTDMIAVKEPTSDLDYSSKPDTAAAVEDLNQISAVLAQSGKEEEAVLAMQDNIQKTLILQSYRAAKYNYELELLKASATPEQKDSFLKARAEYQAALALVEQVYPKTQEEQIEVISAPQQTLQTIPQPVAQTQDIPAQTITPVADTPSAPSAAPVLAPATQVAAQPAQKVEPTAAPAKVEHKKKAAAKPAPKTPAKEVVAQPSVPAATPITTPSATPVAPVTTPTAAVPAQPAPVQTVAVTPTTPQPAQDAPKAQAATPQNN